jgi:hypothetical protein
VLAQHGQRAPVGRLAAVPIGHAGRVDLDLAGQPGLAHQVLKHRLGHGRAADVAEADEEDFDHVGWVR